MDQSAGAADSRQVHRAVGLAVPCVTVKYRGWMGKNRGACTGSAILRKKDATSRMGGAKSQRRPFPYFPGSRSTFPVGVGGERRNWGWRRAGRQALKN